VKVTSSSSAYSDFNLFAGKAPDWLERNTPRMDILKARLEEYTRWFNDEDDKSPVKNIVLVSSIGDEQVIDPVVWHEPSIDIYWQNFFTALRQKITTNQQFVKITLLVINGVEMTKETVDLMAEVFGQMSINSIESINFEAANLCGEGLISLTKLVEQSLELKRLEISHNLINDMNVVITLSRVVRFHPRIKYLDMSYCNLGNNPEILSVILQSNVKNLDLSHNNIDSLGAIKIAEHIQGNKPIEYLRLHHNNLNDEDALLLSQALMTNTNLTGLEICSNNLTSVGIRALFSCVFDHTSLNTIYKSNHTCSIFALGLGWTSINSELNRTDKLLLAIQNRDSLLGYLANVPVELMPHLLACLDRFWERESDAMTNQEHGKILSRSMVYVAMRWWNMLSLYSYYNSSGKVNTPTKKRRIA
jgi:hypothetical protein